MSIQFDEVVGTVAEPSAPSAPPSSAPTAPEARPDPERLRRELRLLSERRARLHAD